MPSNTRNSQRDVGIGRSAAVRGLYPNAPVARQAPASPSVAVRTMRPSTHFARGPIDSPRSLTPDSFSDDDWNGVSAEELNQIAEAEAAEAARQQEEADDLRRATMQSVIDAEERENQRFQPALAASSRNGGDQQLFIEMQRFRGSIGRSQEAAAEEEEEVRRVQTAVAQSLHDNQFVVEGLTEDEQLRLALSQSAEQSSAEQSARSEPPLQRRSSLSDRIAEARTTLRVLQDRAPTPPRAETPLPAPRARHVEQPEWLDDSNGPRNPWAEDPSPVTQQSDSVLSSCVSDAPLSGLSTPAASINSGRTSRTSIHPSPGRSGTHSVPSVAQPHRPTIDIRGHETSVEERTTPSPLRQDSPPPSPRPSSMVSLASPVAIYETRSVIPTPDPQSPTQVAVTPRVNHEAHHVLQQPATHISQPMNFYGPVVINNLVVRDKPAEKKNSLLMQAVTQRYRRVKDKAVEFVASKGYVDGNGNRVGTFAKVQDGMEALNVRTGANRMSLEIDDDAVSRSVSPSPSFVSRLEHIDERVQAAAGIDRNGSPATIRPGPLHVVNPRSPSPPSTPRRRPVPDRAQSIVRSASEFHDSGIFTDSNVGHGQRSSTPTPAPRTEGQPPASIRRRPVSVVSSAPEPPGMTEGPQQYPVPIPAADRERTDSPDSMRAQPDSPDYTLAALARKHVHPSYQTEWANVPTADQRLDHLNSRSMQDIDRFGTGSMTAMPVLPGTTGDHAQQEVDRSMTPNTKAKKMEKDAQKRLRGRM